MKSAFGNALFGTGNEIGKIGGGSHCLMVENCNAVVPIERFVVKAASLEYVCFESKPKDCVVL